MTLLLDLGAPPHVVREIVGHSDIEITMAIYPYVSLDLNTAQFGNGDRAAVTGQRWTQTVDRTRGKRMLPIYVASRVDGSVSLPAHWQRYEYRSALIPAPSREQTATDAAEEIAAYALIRAWMADDADTGMLMIKQHAAGGGLVRDVAGESRLAGGVVG